jgi:ABC-type molybdate transport system substrate-binding protein
VQQAILLQRAADKEAAKSFLQFLQSDWARDTIRRSGYGVP